MAHTSSRRAAYYAAHAFPTLRSRERRGLWARVPPAASSGTRVSSSRAAKRFVSRPGIRNNKQHKLKNNIIKAKNQKAKDKKAEKEAQAAGASQMFKPGGLSALRKKVLRILARLLFSKVATVHLMYDMI